MSKKSKQSRWIIGGVVIVGAIIGLSFINLGDNLVYFYTPEEALAKAAELDGQTIKLGALVKPGSVKWEPESLSLQFEVTDNRGHTVVVKHTGSPPDLFKENQGVVVEGRLTDGGSTIVSHHLMVKHSEEYVSPDDPTSMDKQLLEESLFKKP